jgi:hypothetical protein
MMTSHDKRARLAGLLYLILLPTAGFGMFGAAGLVVPGDPAATLAHIQASRTLFEFAFFSAPSVSSISWPPVWRSTRCSATSTHAPRA